MVRLVVRYAPLLHRRTTLTPPKACSNQFSSVNVPRLGAFDLKVQQLRVSLFHGQFFR